MKYLGSLGLSQKDNTVLSALVDLLGARTLEEWGYSDPEVADVLILDGDNAVAVEQWKRLYSGFADQTILYSTSKSHRPVPARMHLGKPLRAADLISHLNTMNDAQSPAEVADFAPEVPIRNHNDSSDSVPLTSLAQTIFDTDTGYLTISSGEYLLTLNRDESSCVMTGSIQQVVESLCRQQGDIEISFSRSRPQSLSEASVWLADRSIVWQLSTCCGEQPELLQQFGPTDRLRLMRWPPPSLLKHEPGYVNICAMLSRPSGASFNDVAAQLNLADSDIIGFLNAAANCGMLKKHSRASVEAIPSTTGSTESTAPMGLFARLRSRLGI